MTWDDDDFNSSDPFIRFNAHQAAKGRAGIGDPDLQRQRQKENHDRPVHVEKDRAPQDQEGG